MLGLAANHIPVLVHALVVLVYGFADVLAALCRPLHEVVGLVAVASLQVHDIHGPFVLAVSASHVAALMHESAVCRDACAGQSLSGHVVVQCVGTLLLGIHLYASKVRCPQGIPASQYLYLHSVGSIASLLQFQYAIVSASFQYHFSALLFSVHKERLLALGVNHETHLLILVVVHGEAQQVYALVLDYEASAVGCNELVHTLFC